MVAFSDWSLSLFYTKMSSKTKKIVTLLIILAAAGAATGYYLWNKPHLNVAGTEGIKTDATALYTAFISDSAAAQKKYVQQVVELSGNISSISANQQNKMIVLIKTTTAGAYINCTLEEQVNNLKEGNLITIKGICSGLGQGDADLGIMGDVYLVRCYLIK